MRLPFFLLSSACATALIACAPKCYQERFCMELIGQPTEQIVATLGPPTHTERQGDTQVLEWAYDGSYRVARLVQDYPGPWGYPYPYYWAAPPYVVEETVPRTALLRYKFADGRATGYEAYSNGSDMCNYFIPPAYLERYRQEEREKTY